MKRIDALLYHLLALLLTGLLVVGCEGDDGAPGAAGPA
jgi:hypothetical protein